jgi:acetyl esterase/lipase
MAATGVRYGEHRAQRAELWLPDAARRFSGPLPVVVLIHGGFWGRRYTKALMRPLARSVASRGWAAWNIEYRRLDCDGGWPMTFTDAGAAVDHLALLDRGPLNGATLDLTRVVTCGHSAGGHLALWAAARHNLAWDEAGADPAVRPMAAIALAGVSDLGAAATTRVGGDSVPRLMGGLPTHLPRRYATVSPLQLGPLGVQQILVHGTADDVVPLAMSERYVERARGQGDRAVLERIEGATHRSMISARSAGWAATSAHLHRLFGSS